MQFNETKTATGNYIKNESEACRTLSHYNSNDLNSNGTDLGSQHFDIRRTQLVALGLQDPYSVCINEVYVNTIENSGEEIEHGIIINSPHHSNKRNTASSELYICSICDFVSHYDETLRKHQAIENHYDENLLCPLCHSIRSTSFADFETHVFERHRHEAEEIVPLKTVEIFDGGFQQIKLMKIADFAIEVHVYNCSTCAFESSRWATMKFHLQEKRKSYLKKISSEQCEIKIVFRKCTVCGSKSLEEVKISERLAQYVCKDCISHENPVLRKPAQYVFCPMCPNSRSYASSYFENHIFQVHRQEATKMILFKTITEFDGGLLQTKLMEVGKFAFELNIYTCKNCGFESVRWQNFNVHLEKNPQCKQNSFLSKINGIVP